MMRGANNMGSSFAGSSGPAAGGIFVEPSSSCRAHELSACKVTHVMRICACPLLTNTRTLPLSLTCSCSPATLSLLFHSLSFSLSVGGELVSSVPKFHTLPASSSKQRGRHVRGITARSQRAYQAMNITSAQCEEPASTDPIIWLC